MTGLSTDQSVTKNASMPTDEEDFAQTAKSAGWEGAHPLCVALSTKGHQMLTLTGLNVGLG